ncbi:tetratricopeptide repeat-containing sulfotransferase family protein [Acetobacter malorum]|uniref:tetratricopeptide repeat-containing sulfotransferase family protein n=1 Tax=Acetobacter malorum TaxID=178901 RepID=UPI00248D9A53|nr:tetratricopeptide repeat-containing sulfotransferase family protein [Acetobacter malorum]
MMPNFLLSNLKQARSALEQGNVPKTQSLAMAVLAQDARSAAAYFLLGVCEMTRGNIRSGKDLLETSVGFEPSVEGCAQLARVFLLLRRDADALAALQEAEACLNTGKESDAITRDTIGCAYSRLGMHAASLAHFEAATRGAPSNTAFFYNWAVALSFVGRIDEADKAFEALIARAPDNARAHHGLSGLRRQTAERNHVPRLRATLARAEDPEARLLLGYALSKELEEIGQAKESFQFLFDANKAHKKQLAYSIEQDEKIFDAIEQNWPLYAQAPVNNAPVEEPVFIIGMPRTGTTLVDRIISSHPDMVSAGELQAFPIAVKAASGVRTRLVLDVETIAKAADKNLGMIGRDYIARARSHLPAQGMRFSDKFPGNFMYAGLIARALPSARIICLRRHPMDTVLSNFKNLFATTSRYYDYSYSIEDIARYYVRFDRLMRFWQQEIPERILEVQYENIVLDQENITRSILEHCGLSWNDACLSFHKSNAAVSTPSAAQVRRPLYRDALERWKQHEEDLMPARHILEQAGITL